MTILQEFLPRFRIALILAGALIVLLIGLRTLIVLAGNRKNAVCKLSYRLGLFGAMVITGLFAFLLPISPAGDSFDMIDAISYLLKDKVFLGYYKPYYSFWANNKVALAVYLGVCIVVDNIELGIRIVNFICVFGTVFFFSSSIGKIYGARERLIGLLACVTLFPYIILTGPYSYPLALFLASFTFFLGVCNIKAVKPVFFICVGLLFLIRPVAVIFIFVYFAFDSLKHFVRREKKQAVLSIAVIAFMFASLLMVKTGVGAMFYKTGFHPYPNLTSAASGWTLDIGTRLDKYKTGMCTYAPYLPPEGDEIAEMQCQLWRYFLKGDPDNYEDVKALSNEVKKAVLQRTMDTLKSDAKNVAGFLGYKTINLLAPRNSRFYFYTLNYTNSSFVWEAYKNLNEDSETHINALIIVSLTAFVCLIIFIARERKFDDKAVFVMSSITGCVTAALIFVLFTEVGQRCLLDIFIPSTFAVCSAIIFAVDRLSISRKPGRKVFVSAMSATAIAFFVSIMVFSVNDISCLKNADFKVIQTEEKTIIELSLKQEPPVDKYYIVYNEEQIPLSRQVTIETESGKRIYLKTPTRFYEIYADDGWKYR